MDAVKVDPAALQASQQGINAAMEELKGLGLVTSAMTGNGFEKVALTARKLGNAALNDTFAEFCERWGWGVRTLMNDGAEFVTRLGASAGYYHEMNQYGVDTFKALLNDLGGNPHLSDQDAAKQSTNSTISSALHPDYSAKSFEKAGHDAAEGWKAAGRSGLDGPMGVGKLAADATGDGDKYEHGKDAIFGKPEQPGGQQ